MTPSIGKLQDIEIQRDIDSFHIPQRTRSFYIAQRTRLFPTPHDYNYYIRIVYMFKCYFK